MSGVAPSRSAIDAASSATSMGGLDQFGAAPVGSTARPPGAGGEEEQMENTRLESRE